MGSRRGSSAALEQRRPAGQHNCNTHVIFPFHSSSPSAMFTWSVFSSFADHAYFLHIAKLELTCPRQCHWNVVLDRTSCPENPCVVIQNTTYQFPFDRISACSSELAENGSRQHIPSTVRGHANNDGLEAPLSFWYNQAVREGAGGHIGDCILSRVPLKQAWRVRGRRFCATSS